MPPHQRGQIRWDARPVAKATRPSCRQQGSGDDDVTQELAGLSGNEAAIRGILGQDGFSGLQEKPVVAFVTMTA